MFNNIEFNFSRRGKKYYVKICQMLVNTQTDNSLTIKRVYKLIIHTYTSMCLNEYLEKQTASLFVKKA